MAGNGETLQHVWLDSRAPPSRSAGKAEEWWRRCCEEKSSFGSCLVQG